jgi:hypothetical protein
MMSGYLAEDELSVCRTLLNVKKGKFVVEGVLLPANPPFFCLSWPSVVWGGSRSSLVNFIIKSYNSPLTTWLLFPDHFFARFAQ